MTLSRRALLGLATALTATAVLPPAAFALSTGEAQRLVDLLVADVNAVISSGASEAAMLQQFEVIFDKYADVPTIARYTLGSEARAASREQLRAYTAAFRTYIARKYGRRFREFIGGQIVVQGAREVPNGIEVETTAILQGQSPFRVDFWVSDGSGQTKFFNIIIEGINMLLSERTEILALLDQQGGNIDALIAALPQV